MVVHCQLALERIILRLETIKEVSKIFAELKPALKSLKNLTQTLVRVLPDVAMELERVNESITETLAMTRISPDMPLPTLVKTEAGEEILKEASAFLEEKLNRQLPEPPVLEPVKPQVIVREEPSRKPEKVKQMVALAVSCSEVVERGEGETQRYVSYKDMRLREVSVASQADSSLEEALLRYIKECKGEIDVQQCALRLNVPRSEVLKALENLGAKGKIQIRKMT
jgi:hypothetical protein